MKRLCLFIGILFFICSLHAEDIFKKHGFEKETLTLSKGKYEETFTNDEVVQIGSILLNTKTNKVVRFLDENTETTPFKAEHSSRFMTVDPLAEKYYNISPYAYCANNPIKFIDPDGRELVISGALNEEALSQLQSKVRNRMTLSMDNGNVSYTVAEGAKLRGASKRLAKVIDDSSITVNLVTTNLDKTSTGESMVGGAFMGNTVTTDANGNTIVSATQEVNPNVLGAADTHTKTPGKMVMHEVTEAYAGAQISQKAGVGVGPAIKADVENPNSVFSQAHRKATKQTFVELRVYDIKGNLLTEAQNHIAFKAEWSVTKNGKSKIIQTKKRY